MAAQDNSSLSRNDYLALFYALQELRSDPNNLRVLKSHISNGRFYTQPLPLMVRHMQQLLQSKDPARKFPQTVRKEDVPQYFESLLREVNGHTDHDFYGKIEKGLQKGSWSDLPSPTNENTPASSTATPTTPPIEEPSSPEIPDVASDDQKSTKTSSEEKKVLAGGHSTSTTQKPAASIVNTQQPVKKGFIQKIKSVVWKNSAPTPPPTAASKQKISQIVQTGKVFSQVFSKPLKDAKSQIVQQIIRHPIIKTRLLTAGIGALGGYYFGGAAGAGIGGVLGGLLGPNLLKNAGSVLTAGRNNVQSSQPSPDTETDSSNPTSGGGSFFRNQATNAARRAANQLVRRVALNAGRSFLAANAWWIILVIIVVIIVLIALLLLLCILPWSGCSDSGSSGQSKKIAIEKSGPQQIENGGSIEYKITVTNKGTISASAFITDQIPADTVYESGDNDPVQTGAEVNKVTWDIKNLSPKQSRTLTLKVKPKKENFWVVNQATADVAFSMAYGSSTGLLPTPLPSEIGNWAATRDMIIEAVNKYPEVVEAYKKAGSLTGVPWEVLAGLHFVETGNNPRPSASLVSGREIGVREPDIPVSACAAGVSGPGTPIPMGGGCGFSNFEDSAIYAAKHIMGKNGDKAPTTFEEAVTSLSRYNGGGNRNCGRGVPYNFCPRDFEGEDDPYSMNYFDQKHSEMYLIYCGDGTQCNPFRPLGRPGSMAVIRALLGK